MWLNYFPFSIDRWLPNDWQELDEDSLQRAVEHLALNGQNWPRIYDALDNPETKKQLKIGLMRAACCLFWHVFYWPDRLAAEQLEELRNVWQYNHKVDEQPSWIHSYIYIHISGAQALHLYNTEESFSKAVREHINSITQLAVHLKSSNSIHEPGVFYADDPRYFNEIVPIFRSLFAVCSLGWCFGFHIAKADNKPENAFECAFEALSTASNANLTHVFFAEPTAIIEEGNIILNLAAVWIGSQDIVDVFDEIHLAVNPNIDWRELADRCEEMRFYYDEALEKAQENGIRVNQFVSSKMGKVQSGSGGEWTPSYPLSEFWTFARGLCITRLSPDAYRKLRDDDERYAAQDRLKRYFFRDLWDEIPSESQDALIAADRVYWSTEGRKGDILENLRLAIEPVVEQRLAIPFRFWCSQHPDQIPGYSLAKDRKSFLRLTNLIHELWDNQKLFKNFTQAVFPDIHGTFWRELKTELYSLRNARGTTVHPDERDPTNTDQIVEYYHKFIGIGGHGVFCELLRLHPKRV
ncbi:hypothetical protein ACFLWR_06610 [Chloroflexota bacterium]